MTDKSKPVTVIETPAQLAAVGRAIFGQDWKREISTRLDINLRSIQRWISGEYRIPEGLGQSLGLLAVERAKELYEIADALVCEREQAMSLQDAHNTMLSICEALIRMQGRTSVVIPMQVFEDCGPPPVTIEIEHSALDNGTRVSVRR